MKKLILLILIVSPFLTNAQCDCSAPLSVDLLSVSSQYNESEFREFLYQYFKASKKERKRMKRNYSGSFGLKAIVNKLPIEANSSSNSSRDSQQFYAFEQEVLKNHIVTNSMLESITTRYLSDNQLTAYNNCLKTKCTNANGVTIESGGDEMDEFFVRISFNSNVQDSNIKLDSDVQYTGCNPIYNLIMKKGTILKSGQDLVQYFKRNNPDKVASINVKFENGISAPPIVLEKQNSNTSLPIGSIITSTLTFSEFQSLITDKAFDKTKSSWAPCDGRNVTGSTYASKFNKSFVPDLRGQFLRGNFTMGGPSEPEQNTPNGKNPRDNEVTKNTYIYQKEQIKTHTHGYKRDTYGHRAGRGNGNQNVPKSQDGVDQSSRTTGTTGGNETRPMNMYVYYYIRIN